MGIDNINILQYYNTANGNKIQFGGERMVVYPTMRREMADRGIKKVSLAASIGVSERTIHNKLMGLTDFTWNEALKIKKDFFPDVDMEKLYQK